MTAVAVVAVLLGAGLQSATGFGFALVAAPLLVAALGAEPAITTAALLSIEINALTLLTERRERRVLGGEAARLLAWALPGLALGAVALAAMSDRAVAVVVAGGVLAGLALRIRARSRPAAEPRPRPPTATAMAGLAAGTLTTATSLNGPPLVLYLAGGRAAPAEIRDTLAFLLGSLGVVGLGALAVAGALEVPDILPLLLVTALVGQVGGRPLFGALAGDRYERAVTVVLAATAVVATATVI